jgi:hypothetical protein
MSNLISGNTSKAGASVALTGAASATVTADGSGNYSFPGLAAGSYIVTPSINGFNFTPAVAIVVVAGADVTGINFISTAVSSVLDDRNYGQFPNNDRVVQGTEIFDVPAHESHTDPTDSRVTKPVDSRVASIIPENSRK